MFSKNINLPFRNLALAAAVCIAFSGAAGAQVTRGVQYMPKGGYAATVAGTKYVKPSATTALAAGEKIADLTKRNMSGEVIVQRLTQRTYWVQTGFYNTVFYVGDKGVLLMDPLDEGKGTAVLKAISGVTKLPVTTLVYSHFHVDHIGDAAVFVEAAKAANVKLNIVASDATAKKMQVLKSSIPAPMQTLAFDGGSFQFEGLTVQVQGFVRAAHTDDSSAWLLKEEGVLHAPDMTNPDQMPYLAFGGSENGVYLEQNLAQLAAGDWKYFSGGHGNVGSHADITFMQTYLGDLKKAVGAALGGVDAGKYFNARMKNHQASAHQWGEAVVRHATNALRAKYGAFYGFEASVPHQAHLMIEALGSYR